MSVLSLRLPDSLHRKNCPGRRTWTPKRWAPAKSRTRGVSSGLCLDIKRPYGACSCKHFRRKCLKNKDTESKIFNDFSSIFTFSRIDPKIMAAPAALPPVRQRRYRAAIYTREEGRV